MWYKERNKISDDLRKINVKSYKEIDEIDEEELLKEKEEKKNEEKEDNAENIKKEETYKKIIFKKLNPRNEELINKKMLDDYQRKLLSRSISDNKLAKNTKREKIDQNENQQKKTTESAVLAKTFSVTPVKIFGQGIILLFIHIKMALI